jgi:hypothetical protein
VLDLFYRAEEACKCACEIVELDIGKQHPSEARLRRLQYG